MITFLLFLVAFLLLAIYAVNRPEKSFKDNTVSIAPRHDPEVTLPPVETVQHLPVFEAQRPVESVTATQQPKKRTKKVVPQVKKTRGRKKKTD
jgi:hypothetical protein